MPHKKASHWGLRVWQSFTYVFAALLVAAPSLFVILILYLQWPLGLELDEWLCIVYIAVMPHGDDNSVRELDPVQMSSWMDKLWKNSLPEKQLSEQVNRMNYPTQTNGRIKSHWFYYNKDKVNADIVKLWEVKKIMILMNFRRENKLGITIASSKEHRTTRDWLCHGVLSLAMSSRCPNQDSLGTVTLLAMWDAYLLVSKLEITGED